jgi:hypothetical protein
MSLEVLHTFECRWVPGSVVKTVDGSSDTCSHEQTGPRVHLFVEAHFPVTGLTRRVTNVVSSPFWLCCWTAVNCSRARDNSTVINICVIQFLLPFCLCVPKQTNKRKTWPCKAITPLITQTYPINYTQAVLHLRDAHRTHGSWTGICTDTHRERRASFVLLINTIN